MFTRRTIAVSAGIHEINVRYGEAIPFHSSLFHSYICKLARKTHRARTLRLLALCCFPVRIPRGPESRKGRIVPYPVNVYHVMLSKSRTFSSVDSLQPTVDPYLRRLIIACVISFASGALWGTRRRLDRIGSPSSERICSIYQSPFDRWTTRMRQKSGQSATSRSAKCYSWKCPSGALFGPLRRRIQAAAPVYKAALGQPVNGPS